MSPPGSAGTDRCPRCGGAFDCGANGATPCACSTVRLGVALQAQLRQRYPGCLCLACLQALAAAGPDAAQPAVPAAGR
jgi:hypothetical protein